MPVSAVAHNDRPITTKSTLPMPSLLALFTAGFLGILNETVPAGLLLAGFGMRSIPLVPAAIMIPAVVTAVARRGHAVPRWPARPGRSFDPT